MKRFWTAGSTLSRVRSLLNAASLDRATDSTTTFLISSGRSGSTWLMEVLKNVGRTRIVFEPFHPTRGVSALIPERFTYLQPGVNRPALYATLRNVIEGKTRSAWTEHHNSIGTFVYDRRLIKLVRATLMLPWLARHFPDCKFIYLVRHPAAVVHSQRQGGWDLNPENLLNQPAIRSAIDVSVFEQFQCSHPGFGANLVFWAIENQVAAGLADSSQCLLLRYEDLCIAPDIEISKIESFLDIRFADDLHDALSVSSWSSDRRVGEQSVQDKVNKWYTRSTASQLDLVEEVVKACRLSWIYPDVRRPFETERANTDLS